MAEAADAAETPRRPAVTRAGVLAYAVAVVVVVLDQLVKWWVLEVAQLGQRGSLQVLPFFHLTLTRNAGISYGLFRADSDLMRWLIVLFALVVIVGLALWARRIQRPVTGLAAGLILGGAIGNNLIDRVRFGAVTDFLDFSPLFPWIFNVADSGITIGVILLLLEGFLFPQKSRSA